LAVPCTGLCATPWLFLVLVFVLLLGCSLYWSFVTLIFITNRKKAKLENTNISRYIYIYIF